ncbi:enoyl-CoA hydratase-related protein [Caballeronia glebae]|jgi:enoyl-CoA hydratase/carnithine racemase|uniref:Short chain enoyl-CoA hydratase n=1 Tax=Caballeronia glebae TaxID=1777143 RepID=A0A157ZYK1_9BURK|nr:enoyl-CoA hydratase-related protein [Caballeronia glebae]SAK50611.1 short chain enoyl-CoA hydratase [Caballeronia glebae]
MKQYETLLLKKDEHVLTIVLNRPGAGNALNTQMLTEVVDALASLYVDPEDVRCIVLTGAGEKIFCAGGDLKERKGMSEEAWRRQHALTEQMMRHLQECPIPVIAAINGAAFGGGCELAVAVDFAYASETARFALTEVTLGIIPGAGGTQNLPRACGIRRAKEIALTGQPFSAREALEWGVVNKVCAPDTLMDETLAVARRIADNAPIAVRQAKKSLNMATQSDLSTGYRFELESYYRTIPTQDRVEGVLAFNEKRKPRFQGM